MNEYQTHQTPETLACELCQGRGMIVRRDLSNPIQCHRCGNLADAVDAVISLMRWRRMSATRNAIYDAVLVIVGKSAGSHMIDRVEDLVHGRLKLEKPKL